MNIYIYCIIGVLVISAACGFIFIPLILNFCKEKKLYDIPDARKIHTNAIPRLGGISFLPSMFISFVVALSVIDSAGCTITLRIWSLYFPLSILLIYGMGIIDDVVGLAPVTKFIVQIVAACILPAAYLYVNNLYGFFGIYKIPYVVGFPLTVLLIVFIDNAINLIDGIDGLAASLSILALSGFLYMFMSQEIWSYSILIAGLIGVLIAFLYFNLFGDPKKNRKIFMGDSGSLTLGFILGFLCVKYSMHNPAVISQHNFSFLMAFTLLMVPMFDVVRVFFVRISHHKSPFMADKNHIHHKFMNAGLSQHQTLVSILLLALFYVMINYLLLTVLNATVVFLIDVVIYVFLNLSLNHIIKIRNAE